PSLHARDRGRGHGGRGHHAAGHLPDRLLRRTRRGRPLPWAPQVDGVATEVPRQARRARGVRRERAVRAGAEGSLMLALTVEPGQIVIGILVGAVAFFLAWFLLGAAARQRQEREREARMRAVIQPGQQASAASAATPQSGGWIPDNVSKFGTRFAESQGFSERLDVELEAAGVAPRSRAGARVY